MLLHTNYMYSLPDKLGIIGEPLSKFDPNTLKYLETSSDSEGDSESCSGDEDTSEIIEDDAVDDFN